MPAVYSSTDPPVNGRRKGRAVALGNRGYLGVNPPKHRIHAGCDLLLASLQHVPIGVARQLDRAVTEEVLDVLKGEVLRQQERRGGVAEVVEAAVRQASANKSALMERLR